MRETAPKAVQDCHDLLRWLLPHLDKFPRARRFTLGERLEAGLLGVLAELIDAAYRRVPLIFLRPWCVRTPRDGRVFDTAASELLSGENPCECHRRMRTVMSARVSSYTCSSPPYASPFRPHPRQPQALAGTTKASNRQGKGSEKEKETA